MILGINMLTKAKMLVARQHITRLALTFVAAWMVDALVSATSIMEKTFVPVWNTNVINMILSETYGFQQKCILATKEYNVTAKWSPVSHLKSQCLHFLRSPWVPNDTL